MSEIRYANIVSSHDNRIGANSFTSTVHTVSQFHFLMRKYLLSLRLSLDPCERRRSAEPCALTETKAECGEIYEVIEFLSTAAPHYFVQTHKGQGAPSV